jgi:NADPH-dependent 2,4-dienoyl-CoA reductase/sulfur reductase-like enzyme
MVARTAEQHRERGVNVMLETHVEAIDPKAATVQLSDSTSLPYDHLVVATGSIAFVPDIPGADLEGVFTLKNLSDAIAIKTYLEEKQCRRAVVLGAGFIAMELSETLTARGLNVTVVYRGELPVKKWTPEFSQMVLEEITDHGVTFVPTTIPTAIEHGGSAAPMRLLTNNGVFDCDIIICALGVRANVDLARTIDLAMGSTGAIRVDEFQRTSRDNVYAVGDCCEVYHRIAKDWTYLPLGDVANRQGRVAGRTIAGHPMSFPGVVGAQAFKIFDLEVAATGLDEAAATKSGYDPVSTLIWGTPVARAMNVGQKLGLKLVADRSTGRLLGAQSVGHGGAAGRINTLSACLWQGMELDDVGYLDLAYSPVFGGAWDPIQIAAQRLRGLL